jgi:AcrR family transcriptional regulator
MMSVINKPTLNRAERHKQQTHNRILMAAAQLLAERGYQGITIQAITERADIGYGTFYLHFKDKDQAVWAVLLLSSEETRRIVNERLANTSPQQREYLAWLAIFERTDQFRTTFLDCFGAQGSVYLYEQFQNYLAEMHADHIRQDLYTPRLDLPIEYLSQFLAGALMRMLVWWVAAPNDYTAQHMAAMFYHVVYRQPPPIDLGR